VQVAAVLSFVDYSVDVARRRRDDDVIALVPRDSRRRRAAHPARQLNQFRLIGARRHGRHGNVAGVQPLGPLCQAAHEDD